MQPKFYYNTQTVYFISGCDKAILDKIVQTKAPAKAAGIDVLCHYMTCAASILDMSVKLTALFVAL